MDVKLAIDVAVPILAAVAAVFVARWIEARPKLLAWFAYSNEIAIPGEDRSKKVHTHVVVIRNAGRKPATGVQVVHHILPAFSVFPEVPYRVVELTTGAKAIVFDTIVPGELITLSYLYFPPLLYSGVHAGIRHDAGFAREINVIPSRRLSPWQILAAWSLLTIGAGTVAYCTVIVVRWIWSLTQLVP